MSYIRLICFAVLLSSLSADAFSSKNPDAATCQNLLANPRSIPVALRSLLGDWKTCETTHFEKHDYGIYQTLIAEWKNVRLTVKYQAPETAIYVVEAKEPSVLTRQWFEKSHGSLIPSFFDMDWDTDIFPGPTSEHYVARDEATNGQFWIERDKNASITWMRFSYAL